MNLVYFTDCNSIESCILLLLVYIAWNIRVKETNLMLEEWNDSCIITPYDTQKTYN